MTENSFNFLLLKDAVHTPDMQHHLIKLCIEYANTLNPQQVTAVDCSYQPIYALSKIIQWNYPEFTFPKYHALFGALHIEKKLLIANGHLVAGTGLDEILGDKSIDTAGLQTATVDVNHIHKSRYSVQLSVVLKYTCLKKAHRASNSVLPLFSWAEERSSSSPMFKYWMLIMKFQIKYLVFIRSMREGNFKLFVKILISLVKWFFIFDHYHYSKWLSVHTQDLLSLPITCRQLYQEFESGNFVLQISGREFSRIHYDQAHEQSNQTIKSIKGPIDFVNRASDKLQRRWEIAGPEIAEYLERKSRAKYSKVSTKMTPINMRIILHTMLCLEKITLP